jgi:hypothetical protein
VFHGSDTLERQEPAAAAGAEWREPVLFIKALCTLVNGVDHHGINGDFVARGQRAFEGIGEQYSTHPVVELSG